MLQRNRRLPATRGFCRLFSAPIWSQPTFQSLRAAILVLAGIPFACIGGVLALYHLRDMHINVSTGMGFSALLGIALINGVLMVRGISFLRERGMGLDQTIVQGAL